MSQKLRGFVGQGMRGSKPPPRVSLVGHVDSTTAGSFTPSFNCTVLIYAWGAGGSGQAGAGGGGGGAAGYKRVSIAAGQLVSWAPGAGGVASAGTGNDGGDTTVVARGQALVAGGGRAGNARAGGQCSPGWDIGRAGGLGGLNAVGESPTGGGVGGAGGSGATGGGGGSAGFSDLLLPTSPLGNGGIGNSTGPTAPGGGSGSVSAGSSVAGADGRVLIYFIRAAI